MRNIRMKWKPMMTRMCKREETKPNTLKISFHFGNGDKGINNFDIHKILQHSQPNSKVSNTCEKSNMIFDDDGENPF